MTSWKRYGGVGQNTAVLSAIFMLNVLHQLILIYQQMQKACAGVNVDMLYMINELRPHRLGDVPK